ncbi:MAG: dihydroorotate dehydrogenase (quinone), partial [Candidatus Lambdaproteobacteria bacterium]|nr:dihydroorotate dehydrogenase (quinone) [Candidatus Lambdaproteobacteria bacterium]
MRSLLFRLDAETAHALTVHSVRTLALLPGFVGAVRAASHYDHPALATEFCGLSLPNPLGLAAGFDKDALLVRPLLGLGFGAVEVGTVTPRPQAGNARPRLFRLPPDGALINRMGFNNRGAYALGERLRRLRRGAGVVGVNLGKQRETPLDEAVVDYLTCLHAAHEGADYAVINV